MQQNLRILVIEDDLEFGEEIKKHFGVYNEVDVARTMSAARAALQSKSFDVVLLDKGLPDGNGIDLIPEIRTELPGAIILIVTGDSNYHQVAKCLAAGANDYITKNADRFNTTIQELQMRIPLAIGRASLERASLRLDLLLAEAFKYEIIGRSPSSTELRHFIHCLKGEKSAILITGESGTGKELIARRIHAIEGNRSRPFVTINCGALPENLIESELFGHKKGAFTGATEDKVGKFELANGGDLFLDEIAELSPSLQVKLLRVLQDGTFYRVGSNKLSEAKVRIITATNQPLEELVKNRKFREDLYYRLNVVHIRTTPLAERKEDIADLAKFFVLRCGKARYTISNEAIARLNQHRWPGNIRELKNCIERAMILAKRRGARIIEPGDVVIDELRSKELAAAEGLAALIPISKEELFEGCYRKFLDTAEREYLKRVIELCDGNMAETAARIGLARSTVFGKASEFKWTNRARELGNA